MTTTTVDTFTAEWKSWHASRERALAAEHGWLSLTALHWLRRDPQWLADLPGLWWYDEDGIHVEPGKHPDPLALDGAQLRKPAIVWRKDSGPVGRLTHGDRLIETLERGAGNLGLRVRDPKAPTRTEFSGVPAFDPDPGWRFAGEYVEYAEPSAQRTGSASPRVAAIHDIRGEVRFCIDGTEHTLLVGPGLRLSFRDATSGTEAFGPLRHLELIRTDSGVAVDFNRAVNPPCAFTDYGTCPLPPAGNVLPVAIRAGELKPTGR